MKNSKKSFILLTTTIVILLITLSIGAYIKYSTTITSQEFHNDLAKIRGYWAVYGAKELDVNLNYKYYRLTNSTLLYEINTTEINSGVYRWTIVNDINSGIKDNSVFKRVLTIGADNNKTLSYERE